jgi:Recombinase
MPPRLGPSNIQAISVVSAIHFPFHCPSSISGSLFGACTDEKAPAEAKGAGAASSEGEWDSLRCPASPTPTAVGGFTIPRSRCEAVGRGDAASRPVGRSPLRPGFRRQIRAAGPPSRRRQMVLGEAKVRAKQLAPIIRTLQRDGYSMRGIANELTERKVQTPRGGSWHPQLVKRIVERLEVRY